MIKWAVRAVALTIFVSLHAHSAAAFNLQLLAEGLMQVKSATVLPDLTTTPFLRIEEISEPAPAELVQIFGKIQERIFGQRELIELRTCSGCGFAAQHSSMTVFIDLDYIKSIRRAFPKRADRVITYMLAHEISHFTLEYLIQLSPLRLSPSGFPSPHMDKNELAAKIEEIPNQKSKDEFVHLTNILASSAHAEIEVLTLISLAQMGVNARDDALAALHFNKKSDLEPRTRLDVEIRINAIQDFR